MELVNVVLISGYGRSGSTILDRAFGWLPSVFSLGELRHIWERGIVENQLCGCGVPFNSCDTWRQILGLIPEVDPLRMIELKKQVDRIRHIPRIAMTPRQESDFDDKLSEYRSNLSKLFFAIREVTGCRTIVDSSKDPSYAFILEGVPGIDLSIVHLVRDSRAVAFSWTRRKTRTEIHWKTEEMPRFSVLTSSWHWILYNTLCSLQSIGATKYMRLRYEDFARFPQESLRMIAALAKIDVGRNLDEAEPSLPTAHTVSGNPTRFQVGSLRIKLDDEWKKSMAKRDKIVVTSLTLPLLLIYGYRARE